MSAYPDNRLSPRPDFRLSLCPDNRANWLRLFRLFRLSLWRDISKSLHAHLLALLFEFLLLDGDVSHRPGQGRIEVWLVWKALPSNPTGSAEVVPCLDNPLSAGGSLMAHSLVRNVGGPGFVVDVLHDADGDHLGRIIEAVIGNHGVNPIQLLAGGGLLSLLVWKRDDN